MVIALATGEESVRAYLRDKRFPWDFDFFLLSLFSKGTPRVLRIRCFRATLRMKTGKKLSKAELIWFQVITLGVMGSSTLHFPCVAPQLGDSLDPLLVSHGKKNYMRLLCVYYFKSTLCYFPALKEVKLFLVNENENFCHLSGSIHSLFASILIFNIFPIVVSPLFIISLERVFPQWSVSPFTIRTLDSPFLIEKTLFCCSSTYPQWIQ